MNLRTSKILLAASVGAVLSLSACKSTPRKPPAPAATQPATLDQAFALLDGTRPPWEQLEKLHLVRHPYEKLIKGWIFVLDPGHGGDAHIPGFKKGPTGVREAEMNYRVALLLQRLLQDAGATVVLTRDGDYDLSLSERAWYANNIPRPDGGVGADFFISIHHNAADAPTANYTSVWYHGPVDRASVDLDLGRAIQLQLTDAIRTVVPPRQTLFSDRQMYARGFGVLAAAQVPSLLLECSFFSNPDEEQRLRDSIYNLREAYAIYRGICDYARGGRPTQSKPVVTNQPGGSRILTTRLDDGLNGGWGAELGRILPSTVNVRVDGQDIPHEFDPKTGALQVALPPAGAAESVIEIRFANHWKNHNYPQRYRVKPGSLGSDTPWEVVALGVERDPPPPPSTRPATRPATTRAADPELLSTTRPTPRPLPW
jgi:N-acetylmuramoyl-L-alanine amidase